MNRVLPFGVSRSVLDNGLRLVVVPFDSPGVMAWHTVVRTGSRDEVEPGRSGFAHFFEHMMFRGTRRWPERAYSEVLRRLGAASNAYTTDDYTCYHIVCPSRALEMVMDIESDRFQHLDYGEDAFRTEALAVHGEYKMGASNPWQPMQERLRELAFRRHTYGHTTIGFERDIRTMPDAFDYSRGFFRRFYRPDNTTIVVVGDVEAGAVGEAVERWYGQWAPGYEAPDVVAEPPQEDERRAALSWASPTRPRMVCGWRAPAFVPGDPVTAALVVIEQLLFASSAPLYQELVVERRTVDALSATAPMRRDPGLFTAWIQAGTVDALPEVEATLLRHVDGLRRSPVSAERLGRVKDHVRYAFALGLDGPAGLAEALSGFVGAWGEVDGVEALHGAIAALTPEDVQAAAAAVLAPERRTVVTLAHGEDAR